MPTVMSQLQAALWCCFSVLHTSGFLDLVCVVQPVLRDKCMFVSVLTTISMIYQQYIQRYVLQQLKQCRLFRENAEKSLRISASSIPGDTYHSREDCSHCGEPEVTV